MGELLVAFLTLTVLEVVLGVDNVIFISILSGKLKKEEQKRARRVGLIAAMLMRIALLFSITWIARLQTTLISPFGHPFNGRDLILLVGGLFLIAKATYELHERLEGEDRPQRQGGRLVRRSHHAGDAARHRVFARLGHHRDRHVRPSRRDGGRRDGGSAHHARRRRADQRVRRRHTRPVKVLALSFLMLIGMSLVADGFGQHISKGYIYFAMGFSVFVEMINIRVRKKVDPVKLHQPYVDEKTQ